MNTKRILYAQFIAMAIRPNYSCVLLLLFRKFDFFFIRFCCFSCVQLLSGSLGLFFIYGIAFKHKATFLLLLSFQSDFKFSMRSHFENASTTEHGPIRQRYKSDETAKHNKFSNNNNDNEKSATIKTINLIWGSYNRFPC